MLMVHLQMWPCSFIGVRLGGVAWESLTSIPGGALLVARLQVGARHGGVDAGGHRYDAAGGGDGTAGNGLQAARLEGEAQVHGFNGVADWPRAGEVEHVAAGDQVHGAAVLQAKREEVVSVLLLARHLG